MTGRITLSAPSPRLPAAIAKATASDGRWHEDNRWHDNNNNRTYGYQYRAPPVVYATPYNYGYQAPPVVYYNNTPGFTIQIR